MALNHIHLHKLLRILFLEPNKRQSELRDDIRTEIAKEAGAETSGGDFYVPFWADVKQHVFGSANLIELVAARIEANHQRRNLYPLLRDGFLLWWN
ncbi:MAG: hypothetical protein VW600_20140, partial [Ferrovibrio sp.]